MPGKPRFSLSMQAAPGNHALAACHNHGTQFRARDVHLNGRRRCRARPCSSARKSSVLRECKTVLRHASHSGLAGLHSRIYEKAAYVKTRFWRSSTTRLGILHRLHPKSVQRRCKIPVDLQYLCSRDSRLTILDALGLVPTSLFKSCLSGYTLAGIYPLS